MLQHTLYNNVSVEIQEVSILEMLGTLFIIYIYKLQKIKDTSTILVVYFHSGAHVYCLLLLNYMFST